MTSTNANAARWQEQLSAIANDGLADDPHAYDRERYEQTLEAAESLQADGNIVRWQAMIEASAKTGWSLTRSDADRTRYERIIEIAKDMGGGIEFFGPPAAPRDTIDDKLVSVASRYVTPKTGVSAVVDDGTGRLLMVQRADRGEWVIPGGYADAGLSGAEVAIKEVFEESGLEVEVIGLLGEWDALRHAGQKIPQYSLIYHCLVTGGEITAHPQEVLDVQWFRRSEVPDALWMDGDPWLEIGLRAVEGVRQAPYFDKPRKS